MGGLFSRFFWHPGHSDEEVFVNAVVLVFFLLLELTIAAYGKRRASAKSPSDLWAMQIAAEERALECFNNPSQFVQYAKGLRELNSQKKKLEVLRRTEAEARARWSLFAFLVRSHHFWKPLIYFGIYVVSFFLPPEIRQYLGWYRVTGAACTGSIAAPLIMGYFNQRTIAGSRPAPAASESIDELAAANIAAQ